MSDATLTGILDPSRHGTLRRLEALATFMDDAFTLPVIGRRVGADALLSFVPVVGSFAGTGISLYLLAEAWRLGVRPGVLARMAGNVAVDTLFGAVPGVGPVFDMFYKANSRNLRILKTYLMETSQ